MAQSRVGRMCFSSGLLRAFLGHVYTFLSKVLNSTSASSVRSTLNGCFRGTRCVFVVDSARIASSFVFVGVDDTSCGGSLYLVEGLRRRARFTIQLGSQGGSKDVMIVGGLTTGFRVGFISGLIGAFPGVFKLRFRVLIIIGSCLRLFVSFPRRVFDATRLRCPKACDTGLYNRRGFYMLQDTLPKAG